MVTPTKEPTNRDRIISRLDAGLRRAPSAPSPLRSVFFSRTAVIIALFTVTLSTGLLFWYYASKKPRTITVPRDTNVQQPAEVVPSETETEHSQTATAEHRLKAEESLGVFLREKKALDAMGAEEWGGEPYQEMVRIASSADDFFLKKKFSAAAESYNESASHAKQIRAQTGIALEKLLEEGDAALRRCESVRARRAFRLALMIDPDHAAAAQGLQRSQHCEEVTKLLEEGERHERDGNLSFALAEYQEALKLDPYSEQAWESVERVGSAISERSFQQLLSDGFAALHGRNYDEARSLFLRAKGLMPESPDVRDALAQVDAAVRLARITTLKEQAAGAEVSEDWEQALTLYRAALLLDDAVQFAVKGKARAESRLRLDKALKYYLEKPETLLSDSSITKATDLLDEAQRLKPAGPRLAEQINKLKQLVDTARTPVPVVIESDGMTDIVIYRVGKIGRFETRTIELKPRAYTVVGTRDGYKDVRSLLSIRPGVKGASIAIECTEKIPYD